MAGQPYTYDATRPHLMRLFKLDLDGPDSPLSGKLLSITNIDLGMLTFTPRLWYQMFCEDLYALFGELSDGKGYDALSYCWGDPAGQPLPLRVASISNKLSGDGKAVTDYEPHRDGTLLIQQNLHAFLRGLRRGRYDRFIWIDAVCINQGSQEDKFNQIPLMRYVYEAAELVYVWLGEAAAAEEGAILAAPALNTSLRAVPPGHELDPAEPGSFESVGLQGPSREVWGALSGLITRPWWSRLWTLQEVVVAPSDPSFDRKLDYRPPNAIIICGDSQLRWAIFEDLITAIQAQGLEEWLLAINSPPDSTTTTITTLPPADGDDNRHAFDSTEEIRTCRRTNAGWAIPLSSLLLATRRRAATLPADMVIGQMALLDKTTIHQLGLRPSQPARDVFVAYARHYLRQEARETPGLPSWCPDFSVRPATAPLTQGRLGPISVCDEQQQQQPEGGDTAPPAFHAGFTTDEGGGGRWAIPRRKLFHARYFANILRGRDSARGLYATDDPRQVRPVEGSPGRICLSGLEVDVVTDVAEDVLNRHAAFLSTAARMRQMCVWVEQCLAMARGALSGEVVENSGGFEAVARTLVADGCGTDCAAAFLRLWQLLQAGTPVSSSPGEMDANMQSYLRVLRRVARRRRYFVTKGGRVGLGPVGMAVDDVVVVAFYCPTPYLLRRRGLDFEDLWELVGEAYVHGIMYGEALRLFDEGRVKEKSWVVE
ncbi:hypothetical protein Daus18300_012437 [Diaporthe australafricana]|uniref:Heterokaryon incompatibility domain-containing protein n=1 Tax=Diaporthe australafricana TaxID=127596 RepID=A0ABR3W2Z7_9PEZI